MVHYTFIDWIIGFFLLYEGIIGYVKGIRMVLFDIVKFIGSWLITAFFYKMFYVKIVSLSWFQSIVEFFRVISLKLFENKFPIVSFFPWSEIVFCLLLFLLLFVLFKILILGFGESEVTIVERCIGFVTSFLKGAVYLFLFVALLDPLVQNIMGFWMPETVSKSIFLPYLYEYNFLLNFIGGN